jgi:VIT1/CCC1 family predicted Fe2+/Mn2+ transporter
VTFGSFILLGAVPLIAFLYFGSSSEGTRAYALSTFLTAIALFLIGAVKARFVSRSWYRSGLETLIVGGAAASLAYFVGSVLGRLG